MRKTSVKNVPTLLMIYKQDVLRCGTTLRRCGQWEKSWTCGLKAPLCIQ